MTVRAASGQLEAVGPGAPNVHYALVASRWVALFQSIEGQRLDPLRLRTEQMVNPKIGLVLSWHQLRDYPCPLRDLAADVRLH